MYVFQQVWENLRTIIASYQTYMFWYTLVVSFVSFLVCYRIGPPRNERSKNIVMWTLQVFLLLACSLYYDAILVTPHDSLYMSMSICLVRKRVKNAAIASFHIWIFFYRIDCSDSLPVIKMQRTVSTDV